MKFFLNNSLLAQGSLFSVFSIFIISRSVKMRDFGTSFLSPGLFPFIFGVILLILAINLIRKGYKEFKNSNTISKKNKVEMKDKVEKEITAKKESVAETSLLSVFLVVIFSISYWFFLHIFGFLFSSFLYLFTFMFYIGERRLSILIGISFFTPVISYLIFSIGLGINLP